MSVFVKICGLSNGRDGCGGRGGRRRCARFRVRRIAAPGDAGTGPEADREICRPRRRSRVAVMKHPSQVEVDAVLDVFSAGLAADRCREDFARLTIPAETAAAGVSGRRRRWIQRPWLKQPRALFEARSAAPDSGRLEPGGRAGRSDPADAGRRARSGQRGRGRHRTGPAVGVDVSSGVEERQRGIKDRDKIAAFIRAAKTGRINADKRPLNGGDVGVAV